MESGTGTLKLRKQRPLPSPSPSLMYIKIIRKILLKFLKILLLFLLINESFFKLFKYNLEQQSTFNTLECRNDDVSL